MQLQVGRMQVLAVGPDHLEVAVDEPHLGARLQKLDLGGESLSTGHSSSASRNAITSPVASRRPRS